MAGDAYGAETQEEPKAQEDIGKQQAAKDQQEVIALAGADWEKQVAERDEKIAALEVRVAEVAKNLKVAEALRGEIVELKAQGESDRIDFKLQLAGVRSMRYTFGSCAFTTIDSRGFDPSTLIHVLGLLFPGNDIRRLDLGAALERHHGLAVLLLVFDFASWRKRHRVGQ